MSELPALSSGSDVLVMQSSQERLYMLLKWIERGKSACKNELGDD